VGSHAAGAIRKLLEHTARLRRHGIQRGVQPEGRYDLPLLDIFKQFQKPQITRWPPGTRMSYSNPGNAIAGYLIEKSGRTAFDLYIRRNFLARWAWKRADFPFTSTQINRCWLPVMKRIRRGLSDIHSSIWGGACRGFLKASPGELASWCNSSCARAKTGETANW